MSNYFYAGITVYLKDNAATNERLAMLARVIPQLQAFIAATDAPKEIAESFEFNHLNANQDVFTPNALAVPQNTPPEYQRVTMERRHIKNQPLVRLHFPAVSEEADLLRYLIDESLIGSFIWLFETDLVCVKSKWGCKWDEFSLLREETTITTRRLATA